MMRTFSHERPAALLPARRVAGLLSALGLLATGLTTAQGANSASTAPSARSELPSSSSLVSVWFCVRARPSARPH